MRQLRFQRTECVEGKKKESKPQLRSLYTVSTVIETKVVIG